jgi:hypothetical protein
VYKTPSGFRAMTRVRDLDGTVRQVERYGRTQGGARTALSLALRDRARVDTEAEITPDTKLGAVAEVWFADFGRQDRSPTTVAAYRDRLDKHVLPALGNVRIRELTVGLVDRHLRAVEAKHGAAMAKQTKTVLGQVIGMAVRHDALTQNPVRDASPISTKPKNPPRALTAPQAAQLMALLTYDDQAVRRDLPVLVATMLASGLRLGEACALVTGLLDALIPGVQKLLRVLVAGHHDRSTLNRLHLEAAGLQACPHALGPPVGTCPPVWPPARRWNPPRRQSPRQSPRHRAQRRQPRTHPRRAPRER